MPVKSIVTQDKHLRLNINALLLSTVLYCCVLGLSFAGIGLLDAFLVNLFMGLLVFFLVFLISFLQSLATANTNEWAVTDKWTSTLAFMWSLSLFIALVDISVSELLGRHYIAGIFSDGHEIMTAFTYSFFAAIILFAKSAYLQINSVNFELQKHKLDLLSDGVSRIKSLKLASEQIVSFCTLGLIRDLISVVIFNTILYYLMVKRLPDYLGFLPS